MAGSSPALRINAKPQPASPPAELGGLVLRTIPGWRPIPWARFLGRLAGCARIAAGRLSRFTFALGAGGLIAFAVVWMQVLAEFPKVK